MIKIILLIIAVLLPAKVESKTIKICPQKIPAEEKIFDLSKITNKAKEEYQLKSIDKKDLKRITYRTKIVKKDLKEVTKIKQRFDKEKNAEQIEKIKSDTPLLLNDLFSVFKKFKQSIVSTSLDIKNNIISLFK